jgi:tRNA-dihydrouridine synthase A
MVTTGAILYGKNDYLGFHPKEHPVALQLGGCDPQAMAECASLAEERGYDEVNINVGCPSDRVQNGRFGACLMAEPETVAACVKVMKNAVSIPVTVKSRIGIDDMDEVQGLTDFVTKVAEAGCETFIVHARKAWLQGLSPKENRDIPPLNYPLVYDLKQRFPDLEIVLNGGINTLDSVQHHLTHVDGIMLGREIYANPYVLSNVDNLFYGSNQPALSRTQVIEHMIEYADQSEENDTRIWNIARHMLGLFQGQPGGRLWRRHLSTYATDKLATSEVLRDALEQVQQIQNQTEQHQRAKVV